MSRVTMRNLTKLKYPIHRHNLNVIFYAIMGAEKEAAK